MMNWHSPLTIHLTMASRIKMWDKNQYEHKVGSLLEAVGLEARINAAPIEAGSLRLEATMG
jgi:ABC-type ATPase involved in cell division